MRPPVVAGGTDLVPQEFKLSPNVELEWKMPGGAPSVADLALARTKDPHRCRNARCTCSHTLQRRAIQSSCGQPSMYRRRWRRTRTDAPQRIPIWLSTSSSAPIWEAYVHMRLHTRSHRIESCPHAAKAQRKHRQRVAYIARRAPQSWVRRARSRRRWASSRRAPPRSTRGRSTTRTSRCVRLRLCCAGVCAIARVCV